MILSILVNFSSTNPVETTFTFWGVCGSAIPRELPYYRNNLTLHNVVEASQADLFGVGAYRLALLWVSVAFKLGKCCEVLQVSFTGCESKRYKTTSAHRKMCSETISLEVLRQAHSCLLHTITHVEFYENVYTFFLKDLKGHSTDFHINLY